MPRRARLSLPNVPLHIIQRGNNRQACFFADADCRVYLDWLAEYADQTEAPGALMKALGQRYVQYVNRRYRRSRTLWEGRFHSCLT